MKTRVWIDDHVLNRRLAEIRLRRRQALAAGAAAGAEPVRDELRATAPRKTGEGAEHIDVQPRKATSNKGHADIGQRDRWYLRYQDKGTRKMAAHPFVEDSVEAAVDEAADKAGRAYLKEVGL